MQLQRDVVVNPFLSPNKFRVQERIGVEHPFVSPTTLL